MFLYCGAHIKVKYKSIIVKYVFPQLFSICICNAACRYIFRQIFIRDVAQKKTGKCGNFSQIGPPPSPLFGIFFPILPFIFGRSPMLKTVKKWKWDSGRPLPLFFSKFPHFPGFFFANVPKTESHFLLFGYHNVSYD